MRTKQGRLGVLARNTYHRRPSLHEKRVSNYRGEQVDSLPMVVFGEGRLAEVNEQGLSADLMRAKLSA
jgi:hypothetical protein